MILTAHAYFTSYIPQLWIIPTLRITTRSRSLRKINKKCSTKTKKRYMCCQTPHSTLILFTKRNENSRNSSNCDTHWHVISSFLNIFPSIHFRLYTHNRVYTWIHTVQKMPPLEMASRLVYRVICSKMIIVFNYRVDATWDC